MNFRVKIGGFTRNSHRISRRVIATSKSEPPASIIFILSLITFNLKPSTSNLYTQSPNPEWVRKYQHLKIITKLRFSIQWALLLLFLFVFKDASCQWYQQNSGTPAQLNGIDFINQNTGYVVGDSGIILKTTNEGINWLRLATGLSLVLTAVDFVDANTGFAVGQYVKIKTTNGGLSWNTAGNLQGYSFYDVSFKNALTGFVTIPAMSGEVQKTTDGGISWAWQLVALGSGMLYAVKMVNLDTGYIGGRDFVYSSIDGGNSWDISWHGIGDIYTSISFINSRTGWVTGSPNTILHTINGGFSWGAWGNTYGWIRRVNFMNVNKGTGIVASSIIHSTNGGIDWSLQYSGTSPLFGISFTDTLHGTVVGGYGTILHTTNGGITAIQESNNNEIPKQFNLYQNYPNPFNQSTIIHYELPIVSNVIIAVYDVLGKEVAVLVNEEQKAGEYLIRFDAAGLSSGLYFCTFTAQDVKITKAMILIK